MSSWKKALSDHLINFWFIFSSLESLMVFVFHQTHRSLPSKICAVLLNIQIQWRNICPRRLPLDKLMPIPTASSTTRARSHQTFSPQTIKIIQGYCNRQLTRHRGCIILLLINVFVIIWNCVVMCFL